MGFDYKTTTGLGKQTLGGHKKYSMGPRNQEKGPVSPQETELDLSVSVQQSLVEASGQATGREHSPAHQQKIGLKIY